VVSDARFRRLAAGDAEPLARFFERLAAGGDERWFHPHGLTAEDAARLASREGDDVYVVAVGTAGRVVGYGLLRGWEEGYDVPSLGIAIDGEARGTGVAEALMRHLHDEARAKGAPRVRLKVYPDNEVALRLYRRLGYEVTGESDGQLVAELPL
jgi:ribosomal-protein-alanine N-acetyltransferase